MQIPETSSAEIFAEQIKSPCVELQKQFCEVLSLEQTQAENKRLRLQHTKRIEAAKQISEKKKWIGISCNSN